MYDKKNKVIYYNPLLVALDFDCVGDKNEIKRMTWNAKEIDEKRLRIYMAMKFSGVQIEILYKVLQIAGWMQDEYENGRRKTLDDNFGIDCSVIGIPDNMWYKYDNGGIDTTAVCLDAAVNAACELRVCAHYFVAKGYQNGKGYRKGGAGFDIIKNYSVSEDGNKLWITPNWKLFSRHKDIAKILEKCCDDILYKEFSFEYPEKYQE